MTLKRILIALVALALLAGLAVGGKRWRDGRTAQQAEAARAATAAAEPPVLEFAANDLVAVTTGELARSVPLTGTLKPVNQTVVKSKVAGELRELLIREGTTVKAGQAIARIEPAEFEMRVREREAALRATEANLAQAKRTWENNQALFEKAFISQSALDTARFALDAAVGNRDAAVAQLQVARKALADTYVTAPMGGIVAERFAQAGEKVSPDNKILSIVDLSKMEIEAPVPAAEIAGVRIGQTVSLRIEGIERPQAARVVRIAPGTQAGTRSVPVYLQLDNDDPSIRAGMFAQGSLVTGRRTGVLLAPLAAVRDATGRNFVYAVVDGALVEKTVKLGARDEGATAANGAAGVVEVVEGLAAGDRIVGTNLGALRAGSKVRIAGGPVDASAATTSPAAVPAPAPAAPADAPAAAPARSGT